MCTAGSASTNRGATVADTDGPSGTVDVVGCARPARVVGVEVRFPGRVELGAGDTDPSEGPPDDAPGATVAGCDPFVSGATDAGEAGVVGGRRGRACRRRAAADADHRWD